MFSVNQKKRAIYFIFLDMSIFQYSVFGNNVGLLLFVINNFGRNLFREVPEKGNDGELCFDWLTGTEQTLVRTVLPCSRDGSSDIKIKEKEIELQIDHFSWRIVAFFRKLFSRSHDVQMACYPLLPTCMPRNRKLVLRLYIFKATKGMREVRC